MLVDVTLPLPIYRYFSYSIDGGGSVERGTRVLVPFGRRREIGWVVGPARDAIEASRIRPVRRVLEQRPSVPPDIFRLCRWLADYYVMPLGQVLRAALPAVLTRPGKPRPAVRTRRILKIARELPSLRERDEEFGRAYRQRECYELLESAGGALESAHLLNRAGFSRSVLNGLASRGLAEWLEREVERDPFGGVEPPDPPPITLTDAQRHAVNELVAAVGAPEPRPFLLHGVTGSGKTQVYIELLKEVISRGRGAIVLVPEIALTPQTVARFRGHFGDHVAVLHSGLSDGERYDAWRALRDGDRRVAIGARSAVFAPVRDVGAIIVDEEHEGSYKQSDAPRYHARDVAIVRSQSADAVCVLGSATPSLESWHNATGPSNRFELLELPERVEGRALPPVSVIDRRSHGNFTAEGAAHAEKRRILSQPLETAIRARLDRGEQAILLLNRRGYASFAQCRACGEVWQCPRCNVSLTYHRRGRRLVCHYCFHAQARPSRCERCRSDELSFRGVGTEQVERAVGETFAGARIARMDVDTTSGKWAHHRILERFGRREIDILLGTQMIAKGLDYPNVTLVGVVDADVALNLPDFRAAERTFQLLTQVAGRAGRGPRGGEVLIQTALPGHPAVVAALEHDYRRFVRGELEAREGPRYPPHVRMANVLISGLDEMKVQSAAEKAADWLRRHIRRNGLRDVALTGPAPCPIDRIRRRWRWHFLLRSPNAGRLRAALRALAEEYGLPGGGAESRMALDRDPVALL